MYEKLFKLLSADITSDDTALCRRYFEAVLFTKGHILEKEGKVPGYLYFVVSGFLRLFHYDERGEEVTTHINCPPGFITSYFHFTDQTKSNENLECITDCELLRITKRNLDTLTQQSMLFKDFSISVFQKSLAYNNNRSKELATLSAEERYQKLMQDYPDILKNVPLQYIASFLGMNPKSLSRIRKKFIR